jgi:hypothetical protein
VTQVQVSEDDYVVNIDLTVPGPQGPKGDNGISPRFSTTSNTTNGISPSVSRTWAINSPLDLEVGNYVRATSTASGTNWMGGAITAISPTSITVSVDSANGSGSPTSWKIILSGQRGAAGAAGAKGDKGDKGDPGIQGIPGQDGIDGTIGKDNLFISNTVPTPPGIPYLWIETGLGSDGSGFTFWIEDGQ